MKSFKTEQKLSGRFSKHQKGGRKEDRLFFGWKCKENKRKAIKIKS